MRHTHKEMEMYANEGAKHLQRALPRGVFVEVIVVDQRSGAYAMSGFVPVDVTKQILYAGGTGIIMIDQGNGLVKGETDYGNRGSVDEPQKVVGEG